MSERQPQPMQVVSRVRSASSVAIRCSSSSRQIRDRRSQSRFVGDLPAGSVASAAPSSSSVIPARLPAWMKATRRSVTEAYRRWFPSVRRGQVIAIFMSATTIISVIAGPLCGATLKYFDGFSGLAGWQWLFIVQGLPAAALGIIIFFYLQDGPADAQWLTQAEKDLLNHNLTHDKKDIAAESEGGIGKMLGDPRVYVLALVYFLLLGATYTMVFWLPTLIQSWGVKDLLLIGIYAAIPNAFGVIGMILIGRNSDKHHERRWHFAACVAIAAIGLFITTLLQGNLVGSIIALSFATIGIAAATPLFFALITEYLSKAAAACGIALISSLGNLGPAISPSLNGLIQQATGSTAYGIYLVMAMYVLAGIILLAAVNAVKPAEQRA